MPPPLKTLASDNFNRADNADLGANWDAGYTGSNAFKIASNQAIITTRGTSSTESYNAVSMPDNQWGQFTVTIVVGTGYAGLNITLRTQPPTAQTYYMFGCGNQVGAGEPSTQIVKVVDGVKTSLAAEYAIAWATGDILRGEVQGSALRLYRNDILVLSATDTGLSSGPRVGINSYYDGGASTVSASFNDIDIGTFYTDTFPERIKIRPRAFAPGLAR